MSTHTDYAGKEFSMGGGVTPAEALGWLERAARRAQREDVAFGKHLQVAHEVLRDALKGQAISMKEARDLLAWVGEAAQ